jgi:hypothetical protein
MTLDSKERQSMDVDKEQEEVATLILTSCFCNYYKGFGTFSIGNYFK